MSLFCSVCVFVVRIAVCCSLVGFSLVSDSSSLSELSSSFAILFVVVCLDRPATCIFSFSSSVSVSLSGSGVLTLSGAVGSLGMPSFLTKCCLAD